MRPMSRWSAHWTPEKFGAWLRELRRSAGFDNLADFAKASGFDKAKISRAENGKAGGGLQPHQFEWWLHVCGYRLSMRALSADEPEELSGVLAELDATELADLEAFARALPRMNADVRAMMVREARRWANKPK